MRSSEIPSWLFVAGLGGLAGAFVAAIVATIFDGNVDDAFLYGGVGGAAGITFINWLDDLFQ